MNVLHFLLLALESRSGDGMEPAIGGYFRVKFPTDWPVDEQYDFDWAAIENQPDPFQNSVYH